jgi:hypothetical protein
MTDWAETPERAFRKLIIILTTSIYFSAMARSILDTDLYKLTMQNSVRTLYPEAKATYRFTNRSKSMRFNRAAFKHIQDAIRDMDNMRLSNEEKLWLGRTCPYFPKEYLDWLMDFALDSEKEVRLLFQQDEDSDFGELDIASQSLLENALSSHDEGPCLTSLCVRSRRHLVACHSLGSSHPLHPFRSVLPACRYAMGLRRAKRASQEQRHKTSARRHCIL